MAKVGAFDDRRPPAKELVDVCVHCGFCLPTTYAYHDACHLAHAQKVRFEPRQLLAGIPELELIEPAEWEICCGSAGIYNLLQPIRGTGQP